MTHTGTHPHSADEETDLWKLATCLRSHRGLQTPDSDCTFEARGRHCQLWGLPAQAIGRIMSGEQGPEWAPRRYNIRGVCCFCQASGTCKTHQPWSVSPWTPLWTACSPPIQSCCLALLPCIMFYLPTIPVYACKDGQILFTYFQVCPS